MDSKNGLFSGNLHTIPMPASLWNAATFSIDCRTDSG